ncbi:hypothetical protein LCGC14_2316280, partial [marine sediment metagenome]
LETGLDRRHRPGSPYLAQREREGKAAHADGEDDDGFPEGVQGDNDDNVATGS